MVTALTKPAVQALPQLLPIRNVSEVTKVVVDPGVVKIFEVIHPHLN